MQAWAPRIEFVRDGPSQPRAVPRAHRAGRGRLRAVLRRPGLPRARGRRQRRAGRRDRDADARPRAAPRRRSRPRASARRTRSSPATRCRASPRRRTSRSRRCGSSIPTRRHALAGPETQAQPVRRGAGLGVALAGSARLQHARAGARRPSCPDSVKAPSAIVIEVSTGTVACQRAADKERSIGSTTKLMTALLTLEEAKLSQTRSRRRTTAPAPIESKIGLQPGERMKVSDLMRGLLLESGNDAAVTLAEGVSGSRKAFVREMNRRARSLGLKHTHFANPIGLDQEGNYSSARDLVTLATVLRTNTFFKKVVDSPVGTLKTGVRPRTFTQPQPARAQLRLRQRRQDRPHARRGLRARRQRQPQRHPARQRRARHAERGRPRQRHDGALQLGVPALPAHPRGDQGPRDGDGADPLPRRRRAQARRRRARSAGSCCAGTATRSRSTSTPRRSSRGRSAAASGSGASRSARAERSSPRCR